jgi:hypothetical protein
MGSIERDQYPKRATMGITMQSTQGFLSELTFRIQHQAEAFTAPVIFIDTNVPVLLGPRRVFRQIPHQIRTGPRYLRDHSSAKTIAADTGHGTV